MLCSVKLFVLQWRLRDFLIVTPIFLGIRGQMIGLWIKESEKEPWPGRCVVFLDKILYSHSASPPRCINGYW